MNAPKSSGRPGLADAGRIGKDAGRIGKDAALQTPAVTEDSNSSSSRRSNGTGNMLVTNYTRSFELDGSSNHVEDEQLDLTGHSRNTYADDPHNVEQDGGYSVTGIELFSDLVIVVAIHVIANPLEEEGIAAIPWYLIRVFHLWLIWHSAMIAFHLSHLFKDSENVLHYAVVLAYMILVMLLSQHYRTGDNWGALIINLILRSFEVIAFAIQVNRQPPMYFDSARLAILRLIPKSMAPNFVVTELIPISLSLTFRVDGQPRMSLLWVSMALVMAQRTYGAYKVDVIQRDSKTRPVKVFDGGLMKERYELLALIFIGEIAFAAAGPSDEWRSIGYCIFVMLAAFGCFLLVFTARQPTVVSITEFWSRTGVHIMTGQHCYFGLFCAVPGIAAGYIHIAESMEEVENEKEQGNIDISCDPTSSGLLVLSSSTFLIFSALVHSMTNSKRDTNLKQWQLMTIRFFAAIPCAALYFLPIQAACAGEYPVAAFTVPIIFFISACTEVWGLQDKGYHLFERFKRQVSVQRIKPLQKGGSSKKMLIIDPSMEEHECI